MQDNPPCSEEARKADLISIAKLGLEGSAVGLNAVHRLPCLAAERA